MNFQGGRVSVVRPEGSLVLPLSILAYPGISPSCRPWLVHLQAIVSRAVVGIGRSWLAQIWATSCSGRSETRPPPTVHECAPCLLVERTILVHDELLASHLSTCQPHRAPHVLVETPLVVFGEVSLRFSKVFFNVGMPSCVGHPSQIRARRHERQHGFAHRI